MPLILHIGCEKTGTTAIQEALAASREDLAARGFVVPEAFDVPGFEANHVRLAAYALGDGKTDEIRGAVLAATGLDLPAFRLQSERQADALRAEAAGRTVILSNEHCHTRLRSTEEIARLRALLARISDDIRVVIYIRRQDRIAVSLQSTRYRAGHVGLVDPIAFLDRFEDTDYVYDFAKIIRRWEQVFGAGAITVRRYRDGERFDAVSDFAEVIGAPLTPPATDHRPNTTLSAAAVTLLARVNAYLPAFVDDMPNPAHVALVQALEAASRGASVAAFTTRDRAMAFVERFSQGNAWVRARCFADEKALFDDDFSAYPTRPPEAADEPDLLVQAMVQAWLQALQADRTARVRLLRRVIAKAGPSDADQRALAAHERLIARAQSLSERLAETAK